jgi:hypothetical protein
MWEWVNTFILVVYSSIAQFSYFSPLRGRLSILRLLEIVVLDFYIIVGKPPNGKCHPPRRICRYKALNGITSKNESAVGKAHRRHVGSTLGQPDAQPKLCSLTKKPRLFSE